MLKLFFVLYNVAGVPVGYVGPLPHQDQAEVTCSDFKRTVDAALAVASVLKEEVRGMTTQCEMLPGAPNIKEGVELPRVVVPK